MERANELNRKALRETAVPAGGATVQPSPPRREPGSLDGGLRTPGGAGSLAAQAIPSAVHFTAEDSERFLGIVAEAMRVRRHYELFRFSQGELQRFIPHQILIAAWGDFAKPSLTLDVVSDIPGVRTGLLNDCRVHATNLVTHFYVRWVAGGRQPLLLGNPAEPCPNRSGSACALHLALQDMRSVLVHGLRNDRDRTESLYLAINSSSIANGHNHERLRLLADVFVSQIDVAFRNVAALKSARTGSAGNPPAGRDELSAREAQLMACITEGRTNQGAAALLGISSNTVKNHLKRIFDKLGASNRTEAVARFGRIQSKRIQRLR